MSAVRWADAVLAAQLFAVDPGIGLLLRVRAGPVRDRLLAALKAALPAGQPFRQLPLHIADSRLLGGLDLDATLRAGRPVAERGLLAEAHGGVVMLAMAERVPPSTMVHLTAAMDSGEALVERDGLSLRWPARFGVVALDEGIDDEAAPAALRDRLALHLDLDDMPVRDAEEFALAGEETDVARRRLPGIATQDEQTSALCHAAAALGIVSLRAPMLALRVARASAAWYGHAEVEQDDIARAARMVLAPRALVLPPQTEPGQEPDQQPPQDPSKDTSSEHDEPQQPDLDRALDEVILAAARAAIPPGLLAALQAEAGARRSRSAGKSGAMQKSGQRGRPNGTRRGELRGGAKLNVIETLRAAAPWQALRRRAAGDTSMPPRILVEKDDLRISRFRQRSETATIFVVDASGSAALHRLAEAKGAVELLLADCYVRRDQVAVIAFRGAMAEVLLPPTRSLARAKRSLAGLPGGGGTPLAAGLDAAFLMADAVRRKGQTPSVIVLTDGRANIARDGAQGRPRAEQDATGAAQQLRVAGVSSVLVDMSPRPGPLAEALAREMGARYLPLPYADAATLSRAVLATMPRN
ncbi:MULTISPECIES: magnesium chelatase subunit D [unclassified Tardiphaga]|uniref:magnesium chelatase subunit D n=1 Tax=unclassified Tardiphaga TaxID=2631404 RepID=UPI00116472D6|nr:MULTISPECIES: magnesium chelatase subunit D [unclassified Tardiphaga]QDM15653.1 magnesium chelatase subunit D [Tardiphaga sp. vice278]QDM20715.1 magnesium chelatase subunit D [Tardiphaga sp. vice154]